MINARIVSPEVVAEMRDVAQKTSRYGVEFMHAKINDVRRICESHEALMSEYLDLLRKTEPLD